MTAMTRSASISPLSMRSARPEASETLSSATLWTSMGWGFDMASGPSSFADSAGSPVHRLLDHLQRRADGASPTGRHEPDGSLHLRPHAAARELLLLRDRAHLLRGHPVQRPLVLGAVAEHHVLDVGGDHEHLRADVPAEQRCREVLVDDGLDPA